MKRQYETTFAVNAEEKGLLEALYGTGKAGKARIRRALINPYASTSSKYFKEMTTKLDQIRTRLDDICRLLELRQHATPEETVLVYAALIGLWERIIEDASQTLSSK